MTRFLIGFAVGFSPTIITYVRYRVWLYRRKREKRRQLIEWDRLNARTS